MNLILIPRLKHSSKDLNIPPFLHQTDEVVFPTLPIIRWQTQNPTEVLAAAVKVGFYLRTEWI